ncbi:FecR family protein [Methylobacter sp.]|uniref:FecR family protein n=1 Tax=Methylobacter sp. TaxID=2051955 RepID=UPI002FDEA930
MNKIKQEAALWFARVQHTSPDDPNRRRFETWLRQSPAHAEAYAAFEKLWSRLDSKADLEAMANALEHKRAQEFTRRRRLLKGGAVVLLLGSGLGELLYQQWLSYPLWQSALQTAVGEIGDQLLPDSSRLTLGADSRVQVAFSHGERRVELLQGEVLFDIARDEQRPFIIGSGIAQITVLGTRFVVTRLAHQVRVSVQRGRVEVSSGHFWNRRRLVLEAGEVAEVAATGNRTDSPQKVRRDADDAFAFTRGSLVFTKASLNELAETLSRYHRRPVRVLDGVIGVPAITAVVHTDDIDGFLDVLPRISPVSVLDNGKQIWLGSLVR